MEAALIERRLREEDESEIDYPRNPNAGEWPPSPPRNPHRVAVEEDPAPEIHRMFDKVLTCTDTLVDRMIIPAGHGERLMAALTEAERQQMDRGSLRIAAITDVDRVTYDMELKRNAAGAILLKSKWSDLVKRHLLCSGDRVVGVGYRLHPRDRLRLYIRVIRR